MHSYVDYRVSKNQYNITSFDNQFQEDISIFDVLNCNNIFGCIHSIKLSMIKFGTILELDLSKNLHQMDLDFFSLPITEKQQWAIEVLNKFKEDKVAFLAKASNTILTNFSNLLIKGIYIEGELLGNYLKQHPDEEVYLTIIAKDDVYGFLDHFEYDNEIERPVILQLMKDCNISDMVYDVLYRFKSEKFNEILADFVAIRELSERWFWYLRMSQYGTNSKARDEFTRYFYEDMGYDGDLNKEGIYNLRNFKFVEYHEIMSEEFKDTYDESTEEVRNRVKELHQRTLAINEINKHNENCDKLTDNYYFYNKG